MLRPGLLAGVSVVVAHVSDVGAQEGTATTVVGVCRELGARVCECGLRSTGNHEQDDAATGESVARALAELGAVSLLVVDAASAFAQARDGGAGRFASPSANAEADELVRALEASWRITQAIANAAFIERGAAGQIAYIAPSPDDGAYADAARAGLENLARTLSIEWARYRISPVAIAPGAATSPGEIAALTGYLASRAGAYFSGCLLDLRGVPG